MIKLTHESAVKIYKALGETTRLKIVKMLTDHSEMACLDMGTRLNITSQSTLTYHLKPLLDCDLLSVRKEGTFRYYRLNRQVLEQYAPTLLNK